MTAPLIGVSAEFSNVAIHDTNLPSNLSTLPYLRAVEKAGGVPIILPITTNPDAVSVLVSRVDGVVIAGGVDVDPGAYGQTPKPEVGETQPERDKFEALLVGELVATNTPTLAICRGVQSLNVALGGSLVQHVDNHMCTDLARETAHEVFIDAQSRLASVVGTQRLATNSLHHQVIDRLGRGCVAVATNQDGHVEALEIDGAANIIGVQWHPEMLRHRPEHLALFADVVSAASS